MNLIKLKTLHTQCGMSAYKISKEYPELGSLSVIVRILKKEKVYRSSHSNSLLDDRVEECKTLYLKFKSFRKVAEIMGVKKDQVDFCLQMHAPDIVNRKPSILNKDFFSNIDSDLKAYFLGFIAADGCILEKNNDRHMLSIGIHLKDIELLEKLKEVLGSTHTIGFKKSTNSVFLNLSEPRILEDLLTFGIHPRKSLSLENLIPKVPKPLQYAYVCGLMDGDGSIGCYSRPRGSSVYTSVSLVGNINVILGVRDWLLNTLGIKVYLRKDKRSSNEVWSLAFTSKSDVLKFYKEVYIKTSFKLTRKNLKFLENPFIRNNI